MKEYDIFLKQRLTEGSIIVYSLPFRDGVSAVNRVVLRAMLSYFSLQKKIAVANQSALLSEIDEMLATVSEKIGDQVCLEASAALTIKYRNELEQAAMRLDIPAFTLFAQSFFALESQIGIKVSQPIAYAKSSLGDAQSAMAIVAKSLAEQKQVFDTIQNQTVFGANDLAFRKHDFESGSSAIGIDQTSPELLYRYTTGMEAAFAIAASIGETEFHYSLGDGSNAIGIETSEPETIAEKKLQIGNAIEMFYELVVETISLFAVSNDAEILMTLNAGMKRYRLLSDLDHKTLSWTLLYLLRKGVRKMSHAHLGCFSGTVTPNVNMLDIFKQNERADNPNSILNFGQMSLRKLSMICPEGTKVKINGKEIPLITGIFELGMDQINITSLEFSEAVNVNIYYMF